MKKRFVPSYLFSFVAGFLFGELMDARYSTLQDLDAGRQTEVEMFSGALVRMGKELGVPTPYNEFTYHMIKAVEEKNAGLFDYNGDDIIDER